MFPLIWVSYWRLQSSNVTVRNKKDTHTTSAEQHYFFLISNFCRVLNVVCFLLGNSSVSEFYMPTFRNTLSVATLWAGRYEEWSGSRMLRYLYGNGFGSKIAWAKRKEGDWVGAVPSRETGCGGERPTWRPWVPMWRGTCVSSIFLYK